MGGSIYLRGHAVSLNARALSLDATAASLNARAVFLIGGSNKPNARPIFRIAATRKLNGSARSLVIPSTPPIRPRRPARLPITTRPEFR